MTRAQATHPERRSVRLGAAYGRLGVLTAGLSWSAPTLATPDAPEASVSQSDHTNVTGDASGDEAPAAPSEAASPDAQHSEADDSASEPAPRQYSPWQTDHATPFVSLATDFGVVYARPRLTLGYGAPFWSYVGLDAHWIVTNSFTAPYIGWRASLPFLDVTMGVRRTLPFDRRLLPPRERHHADSLAVPPDGERAAYTAIDFEVAAVAPLGHGGAFLSVHPVYIDVPEEHHVFDEVLRAVMKPPFAMGFRGGYVLGLDENQDIQVGAGAEYVLLPGRPKGVTRAGPIVHLTFSKTLEGFFVFSAVVDSPDDLGIEHGTYAFLGLLHRWAQRF
ncbi:MAG: hypothetical protein KIT72_08380 [Polyangiaceae bacterium]|nr:hypothetical protein [Polyangiaceae bacterium]MCW5790424.1 hypothetical protein [Polyangiaceae bacterium]